MHHILRKFDHVYDAYRDMEGKNPYGYILTIDRDMNEVLVKFLGSPKIKMPDIARVLDPQWFEGGGDVCDYLIEQFDGAWSSHDGGEGEYQL